VQKTGNNGTTQHYFSKWNIYEVNIIVLGITGKLYHPTGSAYSTDNEFNNYTNYVEMLDN